MIVAANKEVDFSKQAKEKIVKLGALKLEALLLLYSIIELSS
jgi:hypothetical protein